MTFQAHIDRALANPIRDRAERGTGLRWAGRRYRYRLAIEDFGERTEWAFRVSLKTNELISRFEPEDQAPHRKFVKWAFTGLGRGPIKIRADGRYLTGYRAMSKDEAGRVPEVAR